jgi:putative aldouronate transport system substrate-binding protein
VKKMISRRILPLALSVPVLLSLAACSKNTPTDPSASDTSNTPSASTTSEEKVDPVGKYEQPVKITWAVPTAAASKLLDGDTWENNRWSRLIKEKLNIDLEVAFSADSSTDAYNNKLNAVIASGDLPDVFKSYDPNVFLQLAENEQLADLTDVYNKYATDSVKSYQSRFADAFKGASMDGKLYAIPQMNDNFHQAPFLWIREDWLKNTNSEPPKTIDEMVALAKKFATEDPDGNGKSGDTVGLALNKDLVSAGHASILGLMSAFGVPGYGQSIFYRDKEGKMTFSWIDPNVKPALALLADMYKQGLINKEFTSKNESALVEEMTSNKIGMAYGSNWGTWYPYNNVYKKDGVIVYPYAIPTKEGYDYKVGIQSNAVGQMTMVSSKCKNPEAIIKILNLYDQTVNYSGKESYQKYWADEQYRLSPIYIDLPGEVFAADIQQALEKKSSEALPPAAKPLYDYIVGFEDGSLAKDDNAFGTWGQMSSKGSLSWALNKYIPEKAVVQSILGIQRPEVWITNASSLETLTITTFTDIITGTKPVDYFDTFVEQWLKAGGQQTLDELDKMYPAQ